jgi:hypothetical protein
MIEIAKNNPPFKNEINIKNIELINNDFMYESKKYRQI